MNSLNRMTREQFDAVIFDLDGVITRTARQHAMAWKRMFDEFLQRHAARNDRQFLPFDIEDDYRRFVDGKPRYDGVQSFLKSRGIELPRGTPSDPPSAETACGLGNRKNELFHKVIEVEGAEVFEDAIADFFAPIGTGDYVPEVRADGVAIANLRHQQGYVILYLSGRPYWLTDITRQWLADLGFAPGNLYVANSTAQVMPT